MIHKGIHDLFESVIAFGDSNIVGFESIDLDKDILKSWVDGERSILEIDQMFKPHSFPNLLAEKLNVPCENFGMSGSCNDRSIRLLTEHIIQKKNSLVIFGYTNPERKEIFYPDQGNFINRDDTDFLQLGVQWNFLESRNSMKLNDLYLEKFLRPYNDINQKILIVDALVKRYDCKVIHLVLYPDDRKVKSSLEFSFQGKGNFRDWALYKGYEIKELNHFGKEAHLELSNLLLDYINKNC